MFKQVFVVYPMVNAIGRGVVPGDNKPLAYK